jgi:L-malate glycosyltransferase
MNITFMLPAYVYGPSGGARVVYEYANGLVARGHSVAVVHPRRVKSAPVGKRSIYSRVRGILVEPFRRVRKPSLGWQPLDARVRCLYVPSADETYIPDGDAIFATGWTTALPVARYSSYKGEKFYLIQGYEACMAPKHLVDESWQLPLHKVAVAKWLLGIGRGLGCDDIAYIPNGICQARYRLLRPIEGRPQSVAMVFSKEPCKAAADGIEALRIARKRHPKLTARMFGVTTVRPLIPHWIKYYSNPPQELIVRDIYNKSSVFLCPSLSEGFGLPPAEAASCGSAIVATDTGGIREYVEHGVSGLLSPPSDPLALAENLCSVLECDALRVNLAGTAMRMVEGLKWGPSIDLMEAFVANRCKPRKTPIVSSHV